MSNVHHKVFVTKYALTKGIEIIEVNVKEGGYAYSVERGTNYLSTQYSQNQWHATFEEALNKAQDMRKKKIASLRKQIEHLERMEFKVQ